MHELPEFVVFGSLVLSPPSLLSRIFLSASAQRIVDILVIGAEIFFLGIALTLAMTALMVMLFKGSVYAAHRYPLIDADELVALTVALYVYTQHALDYEKITIVGKQLLVEKSWGGKVIVEEFNTAWTTLRYSETDRNCLSLKSSMKEVPIGLFVGLNQQEQFVNELRNFLRI